MSHDRCDHCEKIAADFRHAVRTVAAQVRSSAAYATPSAMQAFQSLSNLRTEEDFETVQQFFGEHPLAGATLVGEAIRRKLAHEALTGHRVPLSTAENPS